MCLGVPGLVIDRDDFTATVDFWGVRRQVRLDLVDEPVQPGDYILNHVGFAIRRIPADDVATTLAMYEELLRANTGQGPEDLMAADVRAEVEAGGAGGAGRAGRAGRPASAPKALRRSRTDQPPLKLRRSAEALAKAEARTGYGASEGGPGEPQ